MSLNDLPTATHLNSSRCEILTRNPDGKSVLLTSSVHGHQLVRGGPRTRAHVGHIQSSLLTSARVSKHLTRPVHMHSSRPVSVPLALLFHLMLTHFIKI